MPVQSDQSPVAEGTDLPKRRCGRCQREFDGDPDLETQPIPDWWACAACRGVLFGDGSVLQSPQP